MLLLNPRLRPCARQVAGKGVRAAWQKLDTAVRELRHPPTVRPYGGENKLTKILICHGSSYLLGFLQDETPEITSLVLQNP